MESACAYNAGMGTLSGLGKGLRAIRARLGLSQQELAERAHVRAATVSDWETGETFPDALDKILGGLDADLYDLAAAVDEAMGRQPKPRPQRAPQPAALGYARDQLPPDASVELLREWALLWEEESEIRERRYALTERRASTTA